jgi:hypothetical protein
MSDMGLEAADLETPAADAAEQHQEILHEPEDDNEGQERAQPPLEANEADAAEQAVAVIPDDDEYR